MYQHLGDHHLVLSYELAVFLVFLTPQRTRLQELI
jgi:hypothetical protein